MKNSEDFEIVFKKISSVNLHLVEDLSSEISKNMYYLFICDNGRLKIMIEGVSFELLKGGGVFYYPVMDDIKPLEDGKYEVSYTLYNVSDEYHS